VLVAGTIRASSNSVRLGYIHPPPRRQSRCRRRPRRCIGTVDWPTRGHAKQSRGRAKSAGIGDCGVVVRRSRSSRGNERRVSERADNSRLGYTVAVAGVRQSSALNLLAPRLPSGRINPCHGPGFSPTQGPGRAAPCGVAHQSCVVARPTLLGTAGVVVKAFDGTNRKRCHQAGHVCDWCGLRKPLFFVPISESGT